MSQDKPVLNSKQIELFARTLKVTLTPAEYDIGKTICDLALSALDRQGSGCHGCYRGWPLKDGWHSIPDLPPNFIGNLLACSRTPAPHASAQINEPPQVTGREQSHAAGDGQPDRVKNLLDRAYKMMWCAGYRVVEHNPEHNNPIIAWMADARTVLGSDPTADLTTLGERG